MKVAGLLILSAAVAHAANPLEQVVALMDDLAAKIAKEGEAEVKAFGEFVEWCDDAASSGKQAIATFTAKKGKLEAKISELSEESEACSSKIDDLAGSISANEKDLTDATAIFEKESSDFKSAEAELAQTVDTLSRAISVLEREMAKNPAAFAQVDTSSLNKLVKALSTVMDAASFTTADKSKLTALLQSQDEDEVLSAPKAANYKTQSGSIFDVLEDMKEKAETQLNTLREEFVKTKHNYDMMRSSLESQIGADKKGLAEEKSQRAQAEQSKATAEKDLSAATKNLAESKENLASGNSMCMQTAADHDASVAARAEELGVIAKAKKIVTESTGGAGDKTYSFLQFSLRTHEDLVGVEVVAAVKKLAKEQHSSALTQLASKISAVLQYAGGAGEDPFAKVKGLLQAMIAKLEKEAGEASDEKAYCDEQMSKTEAKKSELDDDKDKLTVKIDSAESESAGLKEDVKELQQQLAAIAKEQAEMDTARADEHSAYVEASSDLKQGLTGVRKALGVLKDYYGSAAAGAAMVQEGMGGFMSQPKVPVHSSAGGAGGGIISMLEVVESDFAKNLATVEKEESDALAEYEKVTQENAVSKTTKDQDSKYKTQAFKSLDEQIAEMKGDLKSTSAELDSVEQYYGQIQSRCIAKAESYGDRQKRRAAEIKGLKEALAILDNETAFVQRKKRGHGHFLGM